MALSPEVLHFLCEVRLRDFATPLAELGIELLEDLTFISDADLENLGCNVIQRRRFLAARDRIHAIPEVSHECVMPAIGHRGELRATVEAATTGTSAAAMVCAKTSAAKHIGMAAKTLTEQGNEAMHGEGLPATHAVGITKKTKKKNKKKKKLDTSESSGCWASYKDEEPHQRLPASLAHERVSFVSGPVPSHMVGFVPQGMFLWRLVSKEWHTEFGSQATAYAFFSNEVIFSDFPADVAEEVYGPKTISCQLRTSIDPDFCQDTSDPDYILNQQRFVRAITHRIPQSLSSLRLCFSGHCMTDDGLGVLARCLPANLQELSLSFPEVDISKEALAGLVSQFPQGLHKLRLHFYGTEVDDELVSVLRFPKYLKDLDAAFKGNCCIGEEGAVSIASRLPPLLRLSLDFTVCNNMDNIEPGPEFVLSVSDRLHSGMQHLCLKGGGSLIGEQGALSYLAEKLPSSLRSLELDFDYCGIEGADVVSLAEHFPMRLQKLHLSFLGGDIDTVDLQSVIDMLPSGLAELSLHFPKHCLGSDEDWAAFQMDSDEPPAESLSDWWHDYVNDALHKKGCEGLVVQVHYVGTAQYGSAQGLHIYVGVQLIPIGAAGFLVNVFAEP